MNKKITIKALGRNNPNQLFAVGDRREEFYFISPPTDKVARSYFDELYSKIGDGEQVQVEAIISGRTAQLILPSRLETSVQVSEKLVLTPQNDDSVQARIVQVDLYSIIHSTKERQFAQYGKHCQWHYDEKMEALKQGKPQERLQNDRLAREVVRLLLVTNEPTHLHGLNNEGWGGGVEFPKVEDKVLSEIIYALMNKDGLLDFTFRCHAPNYYGFESEFIVQPSSRFQGMMQSEYRPNKELRDALTQMLAPFAAEKPQYVLPQRR